MTVSQRTRAVIKAWRDLADDIHVTLPGRSLSWKQYMQLNSRGAADEQTLVAPTVFPAFAERLLGWEVNRNLAPQASGSEGRPDFTPADAVTHPFVFETKPESTDQVLSGERWGPVGRR